MPGDAAVPASGPLDYRGASGRTWALLYALDGGQEVAVEGGRLVLREDPPLVTMAEPGELDDALAELEDRAWVELPRVGHDVVVLTDAGRYWLERWLARREVRRAMAALPPVRSRSREGGA